MQYVYICNVCNIEIMKQIFCCLAIFSSLFSLSCTPKDKDKTSVDPFYYVVKVDYKAQSYKIPMLYRDCDVSSVINNATDEPVLDSDGRVMSLYGSGTVVSKDGIIRLVKEGNLKNLVVSLTENTENRNREYTIYVIHDNKNEPILVKQYSKK